MCGELGEKRRVRYRQALSAAPAQPGRGCGVHGALLEEAQACPLCRLPKRHNRVLVGGGGGGGGAQTEPQRVDTFLCACERMDASVTRSWAGRARRGTSSTGAAEPQGGRKSG